MEDTDDVISDTDSAIVRSLDAEAVHDLVAGVPERVTLTDTERVTVGGGVTVNVAVAVSSAVIDEVLDNVDVGGGVMVAVFDAVISLLSERRRLHVPDASLLPERDNGDGVVVVVGVKVGGGVMVRVMLDDTDDDAEAVADAVSADLENREGDAEVVGVAVQVADGVGRRLRVSDTDFDMVSSSDNVGCTVTDTVADTDPETDGDLVFRSVFVLDCDHSAVRDIESVTSCVIRLSESPMPCEVPDDDELSVLDPRVGSAEVEGRLKVTVPVAVGLEVVTLTSRDNRERDVVNEAERKVKVMSCEVVFEPYDDASAPSPGLRPSPR